MVKHPLINMIDIPKYLNKTWICIHTYLLTKSLDVKSIIDMWYF